jgi:hypothetical protein
MLEAPRSVAQRMLRSQDRATDAAFGAEPLRSGEAGAGILRTAHARPFRSFGVVPDPGGSPMV